MPIVAVANTKGGVGKSTVSVHLAAWLSEFGHRVLLADCDIQQSSSAWIREAVPSVTAIRYKDPDLMIDELKILSHEFDYIVADAPGGNIETSRGLLLRADLAIVPCKASMLEVRALAEATRVLRVAQDVRGGKPDAVIVLSMVRQRYRLTDDMKSAAAHLNLNVAKKSMSLRQVYADAPGQAAVVWQMGSAGAEAAGEVDDLFREILPDACDGRQRTKTKRVLATSGRGEVA
ncbi:MAG: ParA family protein [Tepidisphaeraceae bacterium]